MIETYKANDFNLPEGVTLSGGKAVILAKRDDLRLHLPFNDNVIDNSKYDLSPNSTANVTYTDGKIAKGFQALVENAYIKYGDFSNVFARDKAFSIAFWINADTYNGRSQFLMSNINPSNTGIHIFQTYNRDMIKFGLKYEDAGTDVQYDYDFANNGWTHCVFTYDGSGIYNSDHFKIFINGADVSSSCIYDHHIGNNDFASTADFYVGNNYGLLNGTRSIIDDFRIYSTALTQAEIDILYNSGSGTEDVIKQYGVYKLEQREYFKEPYLKTYNDFDPVYTGNIEYTFILPDEKEYYTDGTNLFSYDGTTRSSQAEITQYLTNLKEPFKLNVYMNYPNISSTVPEFTKYDIDYTIRVSKDFTITVDDDTQDKKTFQVGEKKLIKISYQFDDGTPVNIKDGDTINVAMVKNDTTVATWTKEDLLFEGLSTFYLQLDFSGLQIGSYYLVIEIKNGNTFIDISKNIIITLH